MSQNQHRLNNWQVIRIQLRNQENTSKSEINKEEADQNQNIPKLEDTERVRRTKTPELSECNVSRLGELNQNSQKPNHSRAKVKNLSEVKIKNQLSHLYRKK